LAATLDARRTARELQFTPRFIVRPIPTSSLRNTPPNNLPAPEIIAADITADLEAAMEQFATIAEDLKK